MPIHSVTVYCSSSRNLAAHYYTAGKELGRAIAQNHWKLVYGGNALGLMKTVADAARAAGGKVIGITPQLFVDEGWHDELCEELIVTPGMRERKELLERRGDAFIALPGGIGTLEEILELLAAKTLKLHTKPIVLLNIAGYWDPLLAMFDHGIQQHFIKPKARDLYYVSQNVADTMQYLSNHAKPAL